jgi:hypothetical protein
MGGQRALTISTALAHSCPTIAYWVKGAPDSDIVPEHHSATSVSPPPRGTSPKKPHPRSPILTCAQGGVTLGPEQGEPGADFTPLGQALWGFTFPLALPFVSGNIYLQSKVHLACIGLGQTELAYGNAEGKFDTCPNTRGGVIY